MKTPPQRLRLIESGFPCHQLGAETQRERDTGKSPPPNRLHVWWARRPLTPSRAVDILHDFYIPALSLSNRYDRVAGYFSSSSLAAASQGFSAFVGKEGVMRLIVGADIAPHDVESILAGDRERYGQEMEKRLGKPDSWPQDVENGVELLCWMVARGYLEVRVAFRVHSKTHRPLPPDAVEDGYVHEKWAVMRDAFDNRWKSTGTGGNSHTIWPNERFSPCPESSSARRNRKSTMYWKCTVKNSAVRSAFVPTVEARAILGFTRVFCV